MSKQRQRALKNPRVIAWRQAGETAWISEELPFNWRPVTLLVFEDEANYHWEITLGRADGITISTGGPCATLAEAQQAADMWYRNARSR